MKKHFVLPTTFCVYLGWLLIATTALSCPGSNKDKTPDNTPAPLGHEKPTTPPPPPPLTPKEILKTLKVDALASKLAGSNANVKANIEKLKETLTAVLVDDKDNKQEVNLTMSLKNPEHGTDWEPSPTLATATAIHGFPNEIIDALSDKGAEISAEEVRTLLKHGRSADATAHLIRKTTSATIAAADAKERTDNKGKGLIAALYEKNGSQLSSQKDKLEVTKALVAQGAATDKEFLQQTLYNPGPDKVDLIKWLINSSDKPIAHDEKDQFLVYLAAWNIDVNTMEQLADKLISRGVGAKESLKNILLKLDLPAFELTQHLIKKVDIEELENELQGMPAKTSSIAGVVSINDGLLTGPQKAALVRQLQGKGCSPYAEIWLNDKKTVFDMIANRLKANSKEEYVATLEALLEHKRGVGEGLSPETKKSLSAALRTSGVSKEIQSELNKIIKEKGQRAG